MPPDSEADTPPSDNVADTTSGPPSLMDPSVTMTPRNINPTKSRAPSPLTSQRRA